MITDLFLLVCVFLAGKYCDYRISEHAGVGGAFLAGSRGRFEASWGGCSRRRTRIGGSTSCSCVCCSQGPVEVSRLELTLPLPGMPAVVVGSQQLLRWPRNSSAELAASATAERQQSHIRVRGNLLVLAVGGTTKPWKGGIAAVKVLSVMVSAVCAGPPAAGCQVMLC